MISEVVMRTLTSLIAGIFFFGLYFFYPSFFSYFLLILLIYLIVHELPSFFSSRSSLRSFPWNIITIFYPIIGVMSVWYLQSIYYAWNAIIPLYPYLAAWIFDTGSYGVGKWIGSHAITSISPKKTWEGAMGGYFSLALFNSWLFSHSPYHAILVFSLLIAVSAFMGDLFESYLKRKAHIKHSGTLLPGHGGIFDRFDSVFGVGIIMIALLYCYPKLVKLFFYF